MKTLIYSLGAALCLWSCSEAVGDINQDPNNVTSSPYENIITGAEVGNIVLQTGESARRAGIFAGQFTGIDRQHLGFSQYSVIASDFDPLWYATFVNTIRNAKIAEDVIAENGEEAPVSRGITRVLQAYAFGTATSLFGNIPFDEAAEENVLNPVYEDQLTVYAKVQGLLDAAIADLAAGTGRPQSGTEIYFDGNPQQWIAAAYTLKARFYMHTGEYAMAYSAAQNGIADPANNMMAPAGSAQEANNLYYQFFALETRGADLVVSDFMASLIEPGTGNPIPANYRGNAKTNEAGRFKYLLTKNSVGIQPNTNNGFAAMEASAPLVTFEENMLILAEAGLRSGGFDTGLTHLNEYRAYLAGGGYMTSADAADIQYDAYVAADFDNGGIENTDGIAPADALLREILEERYITLFGQIETFNDTRRTEGEASVRVPVTPNTGSQLPQRFLIPQTEVDRNENAPNPIPDFFAPTPVNQ
ncbi:SusD/RagB family nutrient-binding outer membrane lipoprotein [Robertkochia sediminum]|uniref:SusD/RagB family nutrient-binding outer membrane lipoprotein n=1 Tax=Robertkochia sediminum TaxID=2785326 RepID=UPI0019317803|nr:SusD/RagB family nutrient-binding outer membrane lipoprotein [Robertkochia sediminum]MBL7471420.1 SusD/RagB family nutrient-binding outer membrane lipoprotein [Robertkochia sediminum]